MVQSSVFLVSFSPTIQVIFLYSHEYLRSSSKIIYCIHLYHSIMCLCVCIYINMLNKRKQSPKRPISTWSSFLRHYRNIRTGTFSDEMREWVSTLHRRKCPGSTFLVDLLSASIWIRLWAKYKTEIIFIPQWSFLVSLAGCSLLRVREDRWNKKWPLGTP